MKNTTRRVLILKNVNSDMIEQAILILKDSVEEEESKLICEAEKIVEKYMGNKRDLNTQKKPLAPALFVSVVAMLISVGVLAISFFA